MGKTAALSMDTVQRYMRRDMHIYIYIYNEREKERARERQTYDGKSSLTKKSERQGWTNTSLQR